MNELLELVVIIAVAVVSSTALYKALPFRAWKNTKPTLALFPKYVANYDKPASEIEEALGKLEFKKTDDGVYTRGKVYGDFSAKALKLNVVVDKELKQVKVSSSFFGVLFDTGDIWQVTSDIVNDPRP